MPSFRLAVLPVVFTALFLAAPALAKPGSELEVYAYQAGLGQRAEIDIALHVASDRPAASDAAIYVPQGYGLDLSARPGELVGLTNVTMWKGSDEVFGKGVIVAADPQSYRKTSCDPGAHDAVWLLKIAIDGRKLQFPVLVDGKSDAEIQSVNGDPGKPDDTSPVAAYKLHVCLPPTSATGGLRLIWLDLVTPAFHNPTSKSTYEWNAVVQSYGTDGAPDPSSMFEVRSLVSVPQAVAFTTRYDKKQHAVVISGTVSWAGTPRADARVYLGWSTKASYTDDLAFGSAVTDAKGRFTFTQRLSKPGWIHASVDLEGVDACGVSSVNLPCVYLTISPPPDAFRKLTLPPTRR